MTDSVVCPVCRSQNAPGTPVCVTCGAPLRIDPRLRGESGARQAEVTGLPPGFPLWPVGEPGPYAAPRPLAPRPGSLPAQPPAAATPAEWTEGAGTAGPWGPAPGAQAPGWPAAGQAAPPPGWGPGTSATPPPAFRDDGSASQAGWLPVSAAPRSGKGAKPGGCWNCGQKNPRNREYCRRCGQRIDSDLVVQPDGTGHLLTPVFGGRGRRAVAFIWTVLVLAVVVVVGVVAFGGFLPRDLTAGPGPLVATSLAPDFSPVAGAGASTVAGPSASPVASPIASLPVVATGAPDASLPVASYLAGSPGPATAGTLAPRVTLPPVAIPTPTVAPTSTLISAPTATVAPTATPTPVPVATPTPTPRPLTSATPGPIQTTASPRAPAPRTFTCEGPKGARDPRDRGWRLYGVYWAEREGYDRVTLRLVPDPSLDGKVARVVVETVSLEELDGLDLPAPAEGELAIVVRFSPAVALTRALEGALEKSAVRSLTTLIGEDGRVYAVLGVVGDGCTALQVPMWDDPSTPDMPFVDVTVDVQH